MYAANGTVREIYEPYANWLKALPDGTLERRNAEAELLFRRLGITFAVYGEKDDAERLIPFDIVPRIFGAAEWQRLESGLKQRVRALNAFLHDIYHDQEIIKSGLISAHQVLDNTLYRREMQGIVYLIKFMPTSPELIWCVLRKMISMCWKTICGCRPAFRTCSRTAR